MELVLLLPNIWLVYLVVLICLGGIFRTIVLSVYGHPRPLTYKDMGKWYKVLSLTDWYEGDMVIVVAIPLYDPKYPCIFKIDSTLTQGVEEGNIYVVKYEYPNKSGFRDLDKDKVLRFELVEDQNETH